MRYRSLSPSLSFVAVDGSPIRAHPNTRMLFVCAYAHLHGSPQSTRVYRRQNVNNEQFAERIPLPIACVRHNTAASALTFSSLCLSMIIQHSTRRWHIVHRETEKNIGNSWLSMCMCVECLGSRFSLEFGFSVSSPINVRFYDFLVRALAISLSPARFIININTRSILGVPQYG